MSTALMLKNKEKSIKIEMPFNTQSLNNVESTLFWLCCTNRRKVELF